MSHALEHLIFKTFLKILGDAQKNEYSNEFNIILGASRVLHIKWEMINFDEENLVSS